MSDLIHVAVAVIIDDQDKVCLSRRHETSHQGGLWEFPGGKVEQGENVEQALQREIKEELGLSIFDSRPLITVEHDYGDKQVCLHVRRVTSYEGCATGLEGQRVKWLAFSELSSLRFPAANQAVIKALQLPDRYLITGKFRSIEDFTIKLDRALREGIRLVQLRLKKDAVNTASEVQELAELSSELCRRYGARLMLNIIDEYFSKLDLSRISFSGIHADSRSLMILSEDRVSDLRPSGADGLLLSASCHTLDELDKAVRIGADFAVLSPVQPTASHPDIEPMGWDRFSEMVRGVQIPVYALGGVATEDIETAWANGGQGVAAISAYWRS